MISMAEQEGLPQSTQIIYAVFDFAERCNKRKLFAWVLALAVSAVLGSGFFIVKKEERAVKVRFGKLVDENIMPGIHYQIPMIEKLYINKVERISRQTISSSQGKKVNFAILSGDNYLLEITVVFQYRIKNLRNFLFTAADPGTVMAVLIRERLVNIIGQHFIDTIMTFNRNLIEDQLFKDAVAQIASQHIGVELVDLNITGIRPVNEMLDAFRDVNDAMSESLQTISKANTQKERLLAHSRGQALALIEHVKARAHGRIVQARAGASAFLQLLAEYEKQPEQVAISRYWQRMGQIFNEASLSVIGPKASSTVDINMIEGTASLAHAGLNTVSSDKFMDVATENNDVRGSLLSTLPSNVHVIENTEAAKHLISGRSHNASGERDHRKTASLRSLIFDTPFFFHEHTPVSETIAMREDHEKAMIETLSEGATATKEKDGKDARD